MKFKPAAFSKARCLLRMIISFPRFSTQEERRFEAMKQACLMGCNLDDFNHLPSGD
jgi:hypothetical protein